jgi:hypothetical protein
VPGRHPPAPAAARMTPDATTKDDVALDMLVPPAVGRPLT